MQGLRASAAVVGATAIVAVSWVGVEHRVDPQPVRVASGPLPGYCADVTPPPGGPWGGATVCTPWG